MGWYEALRDAVSVADQLGDTEMRKKLVAVEMECVKLAEDNAFLRQQLLDLREKEQLRENMEFRDNVYWQRLEDGKYEGPYCPKCRDGAQKNTRMQERSDDHYWRCKVCSCSVEKPGPNPGSRTVKELVDGDVP